MTSFIPNVRYPTCDITDVTGTSHHVQVSYNPSSPIECRLGTSSKCVNRPTQAVLSDPRRPGEALRTDRTLISLIGPIRYPAYRTDTPVLGFVKTSPLHTVVKYFGRTRKYSGCIN